MNGLLLGNSIMFGFLFTVWNRNSLANVVVKLTLGLLLVLNIIRLVKGA